MTFAHEICIIENHKVSNNFRCSFSVNLQYFYYLKQAILHIIYYILQKVYCSSKKIIESILPRNFLFFIIIKFRLGSHSQCLFEQIVKPSMPTLTGYQESFYYLKQKLDNIGIYYHNILYKNIIDYILYNTKYIVENIILVNVLQKVLTPEIIYIVYQIYLKHFNTLAIYYLQIIYNRKNIYIYIIIQCRRIILKIC